MRIFTQRLDHRLPVGVDHFWTQQHPTAELQLPNNAGAGEESDDGFDVFGLHLDLLLLRAKLQLQRVAEFVKAHQDPPGIFEPNDLVFEEFEEARGGTPFDLLPVDGADDGVAEFAAVFVVLGAGFEKAVREASLFGEAFKFGAADAEHASVGASGGEQLGEGLAGAAGEVALPLAEGLEEVFFLAIEDQHGEGSIFHVEGVDEALVGLASEVPEPDFALESVGGGGLRQRDLGGPGSARDDGGSCRGAVEGWVKSWSADQLEDWLDRYLYENPVLAGAYAGKDRDVLKEDLRTATFVLRPDSEKTNFRFAHTSLQEYFLAAHLVHALRDRKPERWDLPMLSVETLDFIGQIVQLEKTPLDGLSAMMGREPLRAAVLAFRY